MIALSPLLAACPSVASADTPRELLTTAAFQTTDKGRALALIGQAIAGSERILTTRPRDREATLQRAIAIGYRGKLTRSRSDVRASLEQFERLAAEDARDPEAQMVIAGWHLGAIDQLGSLLARTALGAKAKVGETALNRAVTLGGHRAFYPGMAALLQIRNDHADVARARRWAEAAAAAQTPSVLDMQMKRAALAILPALQANDGKKAAMLARKLLPFGRLPD
ncbi:hypothetical protein [Novosphingobium soli]|uniref:Sel1 repeat family protein n=1 Tax=Novosphingobium soli TaxID=574956 RepID=A0ABV6CQ11_9SPHN